MRLRKGFLGQNFLDLKDLACLLLSLSMERKGNTQMTKKRLLREQENHRPPREVGIDAGLQVVKEWALGGQD